MFFLNAHYKQKTHCAIYCKMVEIITLCHFLATRSSKENYFSVRDFVSHTAYCLCMHARTHIYTHIYTENVLFSMLLNDFILIKI